MEPSLQFVSSTVLDTKARFTDRPLPRMSIFCVEGVTFPVVVTLAVDCGYCSKVKVTATLFVRLVKSGTNLLTDMRLSPEAISMDPEVRLALIAVPSA